MDAAPSLRLRIFWPFPILLRLGLCSLQNFGINKFIFVPNHPVSTIPVTEVEMGSKMTQTPSCACQLQICSMSVSKAAQCPCTSPSSSMVSVQSPWESTLSAPPSPAPGKLPHHQLPWALVWDWSSEAWLLPCIVAPFPRRLPSTCQAL